MTETRPDFRGIFALPCLLVCLLLPASALAQPFFKSIYELYAEDDDEMTLDVPVSAAVGDLMVVSIAFSPAAEVEDSPPDWTELTEYHNSGMAVWVGYKFAGLADLGDFFSWQFHDDVDAVGQLRVYSNVNALDPVNASQMRVDNDGDIESPAVATTLANTMIVRLFSAEGDNEPDHISPPHDNEYFERACECKRIGVTQGGADILQSLAGDSGVAYWNNFRAGEWIALTVALSPK